MEKKEKVFVNGMYAYKNEIEWKPFTLSLKIDEVISSLQELKGQATDGFIKVDIKQVYGNNAKFFTEVNTYQKPKEVTAAEHSPNRQPVEVDDAGLPF